VKHNGTSAQAFQKFFLLGFRVWVIRGLSVLEGGWLSHTGTEAVNDMTHPNLLPRPLVLQENNWNEREYDPG
jgi:hypothetical protein